VGLSLAREGGNGGAVRLCLALLVSRR